MSTKTSKVEKSTEKKLPPNAGKGRPKGSKNKTTALLKDAILMAAESAGGPGGMVGYLTRQAKESPTAFLSLLGKVLPTQLTGDPDAPVALSGLAVKFVKPDGNGEG